MVYQRWHILCIAAFEKQLIKEFCVMKKFLLPLAFVASLLPAAANAALVTLDDFSIAHADLTAANPGPTSINLSANINRTLTLSNIVNGGSTADPILSVAGGILSVSNGAGDDSTATLTYNFTGGLGNALSVGGPGTLVLNVFESNPGVPVVNNTIDVFVNGSATALTTLSFGSGLGLVGNVNIADLAGISSLSFVFNGNSSFDISLDSIAVQTPEPASLALLGAGLVGVGLCARRRKAA
jgi:hypothetical protein